MALFLLPELDNIILKYLFPNNLINLIISKLAYKIIISHKNYILAKNFYNTADINHVIYLHEDYFLSACSIGEKYIIRYLTNKYNFDYLYQEGFTTLLKTNNLKLIRWYYFTYLSKINLNITYENFGKIKPDIIQFLFEIYPRFKSDFFCTDQFRIAYFANNFEQIKFLLDYIKFDTNLFNFMLSNSQGNLKSKYIIIKYILDYYNPELVLSKLNYMAVNSFYYHMAIVKLLYQKKKSKPNFNIFQKLLLYSEYILYDFYPKKNYSEIISKIKKLLTNINWNNNNNNHLVNKIIIDSIYYNKIELIQLLEPKFIVVKIIKNINPDILDLLVKKNQLEFSDILNMSDYFYNSEYIINYYKTNLPVISTELFYKILAGKIPELIILILKNNQKLKFGIWLLSDYNFEYLFSKKFLDMSDILLENYCYIPEILKLAINKNTNINIQELFEYAKKNSQELAKLIYLNFPEQINLDNNIKTWLKI